MMRNQVKKTNDNSNYNQNHILLDDNDSSEYAYRSDQKPQQEFNSAKNLNAQQQQQQQMNQFNQSPRKQWIYQEKQVRQPQYGSQQQYSQQQPRQQQQSQQQQYFSQQPALREEDMQEGDSQNQLEHTFSEDSMNDNQSQASMRFTQNVPTFAQNPKQADKKVLAIITLDVDDGKSGEIKVCEGDVLTDLAREFCKQHQLDDDCIEFIASQCQNHLDARKKQRKNNKQTSNNKQSNQNNVISKNTQDGQIYEQKQGESPKFPMYQQAVTQNVKSNKSQQQPIGQLKQSQQYQQNQEQKQQSGFHQQFPGRSKNIAEQQIVEEEYEDQSLSIAGQSANASLPEEHYQPYPPQQMQTIHHTNLSSRSSTGRPQQRREGESEERKKQLMNEILLDNNTNNAGFDGDQVDYEEQQFSALNKQQQHRNDIQNISKGQQLDKKPFSQVNQRVKEEYNNKERQDNDNDDEGVQRRKLILAQVSQKLKQEEIKNTNNNIINRSTTPRATEQQQDKQNKLQINQMQQQQQQQGRHHVQVQQQSNNQSQQQLAYQAPQPRFKGGNLKEQLEAKKQQFFNSYQSERVPAVQDDQNQKDIIAEHDNSMRKSKSNNNLQPAQGGGSSDVKNQKGQTTAKSGQISQNNYNSTTTTNNNNNTQQIRNINNIHQNEQNPSALVKNKSASMLNPSSNSRQNTNPSQNAHAHLPQNAYDKLYLQGLDQMEKKKRIYEDNQAKLKQKEIAGVTFQPSISPQSKSLKLSEGVKIEDYLLLEGRKLKERKAIAAMIKSEENNQQCTFKPEISLVSQKLAEHMQQEQEQQIIGSSQQQQQQQQSQQSSQQYSSIHERLYRQGEADKINKELWSNQQFGQIYPFQPDIGVNSRIKGQNQQTDSVTQKEFVNRLVDERLLKERSTFNKQLDKEHFDLETGQPLYQPKINKDKIYQKVSERIDLQDQLLGEELRCRSVSPVNSSNREGRKITPHRVRMLPWDELLRDNREPWEYDISRVKQGSAQSSQQSSQFSKKSRCTTPKGCSSKGVNSERIDYDRGYVPLNKRGVQQQQNMNQAQEIEDIIGQFQKNLNKSDINTKKIIMKSQNGHEDITPIVHLQRFPQRQLSANISSQDKNTSMFLKNQGLNNSNVTAKQPQVFQQQQQSNISGLQGHRSKSQINFQNETTNINNISNNQTIAGAMNQKLNQTQLQLSAISQLDNSKIFNDQKLQDKIDILFSQFDSDKDGKISSLAIDISNTDPDILQIIQHVLYEIDEKNLTLSKSQFAHFLGSNQLMLPLKRYYAEKEGDLCDEDLTDYNVIRANNQYLNQTIENYSKINNNFNTSNISGYNNPNNFNNSNINKQPQDQILQ